MTSKLKQLKENMKNPPPERLARIEYKSHLYQALGVLFVCGFLIYKGFWYIIFAFIFSIGISYSQGMAAYMRYKTIMEFREVPEHERDFEKDKSLTRRRKNIIESTFGKSAWWASIILSVVIMYLLVDVSTVVRKVGFVFFVVLVHILLYYFGIYYISYPIYKWRKGK